MVVLVVFRVALGLADLLLLGHLVGQAGQALDLVLGEGVVVVALRGGLLLLLDAAALVGGHGGGEGGVLAEFVEFGQVGGGEDAGGGEGVDAVCFDFDGGLFLGEFGLLLPFGLVGAFGDGVGDGVLCLASRLDLLGFGFFVVFRV